MLLVAALGGRMQAQAGSNMGTGRVELHIAAAADLTPVLPVLAEAYEKKTGVKIVATFGSSATLEQQLHNGSPQDVFLSADFSHPEGLVADGLTVESAPVPYATGVLVLWARKDSPAQPLTLNMLTRPKLQKLAVANDLHAPYGMAATQALKALHVYDEVKPKLVVAENIAQTAQFAESGNAQAGLISLTTANTAHFREIGTFVRMPVGSYAPIRQCGVVLKASPHKAEAQAFLEWLTSAEIQKHLKEFGLDPAE